MITIDDRLYSYFTGDMANADVFITQNVDEPHIGYLHVFYEDVRFEEQELTFVICNN